MRSLGNAQFGKRPGKVVLGGCSETRDVHTSLPPEVDAIHILFEDLLLRQLEFEDLGDQQLLYLAPPRFLRIEVEIPRQLHG